jgi:hypothetical protein
MYDTLLIQKREHAFEHGGWTFGQELHSRKTHASSSRSHLSICNHAVVKMAEKLPKKRRNFIGENDENVLKVQTSGSNVIKTRKSDRKTAWKM